MQRRHQPRKCWGMARRRNKPKPIIRGTGKVHYRNPHGITLCGFFSGHLVDRSIVELDPETVTCPRCREGVENALAEEVEWALREPEVHLPNPRSTCPRCASGLYVTADDQTTLYCTQCDWREPL